MRYLFFLLLFSFSLHGVDFHSADGITIPASVSHGDSSGIVAGCVCPISGSFFDQGYSFDVQSSEPLSLSAYYVSSMAEGWGLNMFSFVKTKIDFRYGQTRRREPLGVQANYRSTFGSTCHFTANLNIRSDLEAKGKLPIDHNWTENGFTNIAEEIGGKTNAKNTSIDWKRMNSRITVDQSDGSKEIYRVYLPGEVAESGFKFCEAVYFLEQIQRSSGKMVFLETTPTKFPSKLEFGSSFFKIYSWIKLTGLVKTAPNIEQVNFEASDGRKLTYETLFIQTTSAQPFPYIFHIKHPNQPEIYYSYDIIPNLPTALMNAKAYPENRYLHIEYYQPGEPYFGMVKHLKSPVGQGSEPIITHRFDYHHQNGTGFTDVYNALNHKTTYNYLENRLIEITRYNKDHTSISKEKNYWGKKGTKDLGNILCKSYEDNKGNITLAHTYQYDDKGNILEERIYGNITGNGTPLRINEGNVEGGEYHPKKATYSQDRFHNKLTETEDTLTTSCRYIPNTNIPEKKLVQTKEGKIIQRIFYEYDQQHFLIKTITDDGSTQDCSNLEGVTCRQITKITPKLQGHCIGFPETIAQYGYDLSTKQEIFLQKIINTYTPEGWVEKQQIYDANNQYRYTLEKKYHRFGHILQEKDPLGYVTERDFDLNGNLIYEKGPKGDSYTECTYDFSNRRTSETKVFNNGQVLKTTFTYDTLGNKITETDHNGHITYYEYDALNNLIKTTHSATIDEHGNTFYPTETFTYDHIGRMTAKQDSLGHITTTKYNSLGKPLEINYPDGTQEKYKYNINGTLRTEITKNGTHIDYEYDALKRVTRKTTCTAEGQTLKTQSYTYNAFHKLTETDSQGVVTTFTYDIFGRLKTTTKEGLTITNEYDPLGNISRIIEGNTKVTNLVYDLLGRKIEERIEDLNTNIYKRHLFTYDPEGNIIEEIEETPQGQSLTQKEYDPLHQLTKIIDPLGNTTTITHEYTHLNDHGQKVKRKIETDPLLNQTITVYDTHHRPTEIYKTDPQGQLTAKEQIYYDPMGKPILKKEYAIQNHQVEKEIQNRFEYNSVGQITRLTEASNTPEEKQTTYIYNTYGQKERLTKPDGISLHYTYDPLGRMTEQHSSDHTIHYQYTYDLNDNLTAVYDCIHQQTTTRKYDTRDLLIAETQANGLSMHYHRDTLGRVSILEYPDGTTVNYTYNPLQLTQVSYGSYIHKYHYDIAARLQRTEMIANIGDIHYTYNLSGQLTNIDTTHWKQNNLTYDPNGNLIYCTLYDLAGTTQATFTYDTLDQLTSEQGILSHTYTHDSLNNRTRKNDDPYNHNHLNQITQHHKSTYTYDKNGNMTKRQEQGKETEYQYDALDRLISITTETQHIEYSYDSFNRRISRTENEITIHYLYQGNLEIAAYQSGKPLEKRILGQGKGDIGAAIAIQIGNQTYAPIHDHNGNLTALIDTETKQMIQTHRYSAFGEEQTTGPIETPISPWRYSSKRKDGTLIHFLYRDYDPELGRWITPDPIGFGDGPNLYAYVHNNPLTHIDHHGLFVPHGRHYNRHHTINHARPCHFQHPTRKAGANKPVYDNNFMNGPLSSPGSQTGRTGNETIPDFNFGLVNGICNTFDFAMANAKHLSNLSEGLQTLLCYQPTHGFRKDIQRYQAASNHNMITREVLQLHDKWDRFFDSHPGKKALQLETCHSYGSVTLNNALMTYDVERRKQISVISVAPVKYIDPAICRSVKNLVSRRDIAPWQDREGRKKFAHTIEVLTPHRFAGPLDHSFQSETYKIPLANEVRRVIDGWKQQWKEE